MFKKGSYVVYRKEVCVISDIINKYYNDEDYYILTPISDETLTIKVPVSDKNNSIRDLINKDNVELIIKKIPEIGIVNENEKLIENEYKKLMLSGTYDDLIKIIKTTYLRNKKRIDSNKKVGDKDKYYLDQAEKYLYTEFSIALDKTFDETKDYVINKVEELLLGEV